VSVASPGVVAAQAAISERAMPMIEPNTCRYFTARGLGYLGDVLHRAAPSEIPDRDNEARNHGLSQDLGVK
jgi:hypothetical protein